MDAKVSRTLRKRMAGIAACTALFPMPAFAVVACKGSTSGHGIFFILSRLPLTIALIAAVLSLLTWLWMLATDSDHPSVRIFFPVFTFATVLLFVTLLHYSWRSCTMATAFYLPAYIGAAISAFAGYRLNLKIIKMFEDGYRKRERAWIIVSLVSLVEIGMLITAGIVKSIPRAGGWW